MPRSPHTPTLPCARCGYDLVGLDASLPCPECRLDAVAARAAMPLATLQPRLVRWLGRLLTLAGVVWTCDGLRDVVERLSPSISVRLANYSFHPSPLVSVPINLIWTLPTPLIALAISVCVTVLLRVHAANSRSLLALMYFASGLVVVAFVVNQWPSVFFDAPGDAYAFAYSVTPLLLLLFPFAAGVALRACARHGRAGSLGMWLLAAAAAVGVGVMGDTYFGYVRGPMLFHVPTIPRAIGRPLHGTFIWLFRAGTVALGLLALLLARHIRSVVLPQSERVHRVSADGVSKSPAP